MIDRKREIYARIDKINHIVEILSEIEDVRKEISGLFESYDKLNFDENKLFENWENNLEDTLMRLEHIVL